VQTDDQQEKERASNWEQQKPKLWGSWRWGETRKVKGLTKKKRSKHTKLRGYDSALSNMYGMRLPEERTTGGGEEEPMLKKKKGTTGV